MKNTYEIYLTVSYKNRGFKPPFYGATGQILTLGLMV
jgi:hypothetical protein